MPYTLLHCYYNKVKMILDNILCYQDSFLMKLFRKILRVIYFL